MAEEIVMPRLSDTMEEGTIAQWIKREGETVHRGETILEVETDKATMELQAYQDGVIQKIIQGDGSTVAVGAVVGLMARIGEELQPLPEPTPAATPVAAAPAATNGHAATTLAPASSVSNGAAGPTNGVGERIVVTPLARNRARQHGIDLAALAGRGSGPHGRIVSDDIDRYLQGGGTVNTSSAAPVEAPAPVAPSAPLATVTPALATNETRATESDEVELRKPNRIQQAMARRLSESKSTIPHFYMTIEVDMAAAGALRKQLVETFGDEGKVSYNDLIIRACALTLRAMPEVNTSWRDGTFAVYKRVNVGVAVSLPDGLVVPVIHDADRKGLREIATEARSLALKARDGKLNQREMEGGTFTISNVGSLVKDIDEFQAIVNPPESAILAVGGIMEKPVVVAGEIVVRPCMKLTLSVDHRVIPGAPAAQFLHEVKRLLQEPLRLGF